MDSLKLKMLQNVVSRAPPRTQLGELTMLLDHIFLPWHLELGASGALNTWHLRLILPSRFEKSACLVEG